MDQSFSGAPTRHSLEPSEAHLLFQRITTGLDEFRDIPREANLLIYASFFNWAAAGLLWITLQIYLVLEGLSFATSGIILTVISITSASSTLLFGGLADRYGRKRFVVMGGVIASLTLVLFALVGTNVPLLVGTAVLSGLSKQCTRRLGEPCLQTRRLTQNVPARSVSPSSYQQSVQLSAVSVQAFWDC
jgi:predicted MFS family arabinose efflux permease